MPGSFALSAGSCHTWPFAFGAILHETWPCLVGLWYVAVRALIVGFGLCPTGQLLVFPILRLNGLQPLGLRHVSNWTAPFGA